MIGSHEAVMIRDSEIAKNVRPYLITWPIARPCGRSKVRRRTEALVDVARSMACS
jgi:hypothetical protein